VSDLLLRGGYPAEIAHAQHKRRNWGQNGLFLPRVKADATCGVACEVDPDIAIARHATRYGSSGLRLFGSATQRAGAPECPGSRYYQTFPFGYDPGHLLRLSGFSVGPCGSMALPFSCVDPNRVWREISN